MLQFGSDLGSPHTAMGFHNAHDHIFAAGLTSNPLAEHAESFSDTGRVSEKYLEPSPFFLRRVYGAKPLFRRFATG